MKRFSCVVLALLLFAPAAKAGLSEAPMLAEQVAAGTLPPVEARVPETPFVDPMVHDWQSPGRYGGTLRLLMGGSRDLRQMTVYGYARLVGYNADLELVPDILESVEIEEGRIFTLQLRRGHKWSDGHPFTAEDFRYWWEDVANNEELSPTGPPFALLIDGEAPTVEVLDETRVRYSWSRPNPNFLHDLAGAKPLYLYMPAHYLKQFHIYHADADELAAGSKRPGNAIGRRCTPGCRALTSRRTGSCRACSPGSTQRSRPPSASFSSATPTSTGSIPKAGSCPTSTRSTSTSPAAASFRPKSAPAPATFRPAIFASTTTPSSRRARSGKTRPSPSGTPRWARASRSTPT